MATTTDFFQRQDKARWNTTLLVVLFVAGLLCVAGLIHLLVLLFVSGGDPDEFQYNFWNWELIGLDFLGVSAFVLFVALIKTGSLKSEGPDGIAKSLGGKLVPRGATAAYERRLYNVVEEIAIAAGCPIPNVYLLENEPGINACAIGTSPENAAVCVTRGAMDYLTRDELQGVIAHEFSHIVNNDVSINLKLIGYLFGLEVIAIVAYYVFNITLRATPRRRSSKDSSGGIILAILLASGALFIIGYVGVFFGNILRAAISRQREYLADASAVQFTRNPSGIAGALIKIGCPNLGSKIENDKSTQASHLFFSSVFGAGFFQTLFQTHPPLVKRIQAIDPSFDGIFPTYVPKNNWAQIVEGQTGGTAKPNLPPGLRGGALGALGGQGKLDPRASGFASSSSPSTTSAGSVAPVVPSSPGGSSLGFSRDQLYGASFGLSGQGGGSKKLKVVASVLEEVPKEVDALLSDPLTARAAFYAVLLGDQASERQAQYEILRELETPELNIRLAEIKSSIGKLNDSTRLIVARKATPLLKTSSLEEYKRFRTAVLKLCQTDGALDLLEYALQASSIRELDLFFRLSREPKIRYSNFESASAHISIVLSYLAHKGALHPGDEVSAFKAGTSSIGASLTLSPRPSLSLAAFSRALNELSAASPLVKKACLQACWQCVANDGVIIEKEAALFSAITAALGAPAPIWRDWSA
ncbi:MAG: M48 family metallopeptidase [Thermoguttaceae bacterium]|nr:M48 family metallopeptidase [Thermoguttaceae bacterium]